MIRRPEHFCRKESISHFQLSNRILIQRRSCNLLCQRNVSIGKCKVLLFCPCKSHHGYITVVLFASLIIRPQSLLIRIWENVPKEAIHLQWECCFTLIIQNHRTNLRSCISRPDIHGFSCKRRSTSYFRLDGKVHGFSIGITFLVKGCKSDLNRCFHLSRFFQLDPIIDIYRRVTVHSGNETRCGCDTRPADKSSSINGQCHAASCDLKRCCHSG